MSSTTVLQLQPTSSSHKFYLLVLFQGQLHGEQESLAAMGGVSDPHLPLPDHPQLLRQLLRLLLQALQRHLGVLERSGTSSMGFKVVDHQWQLCSDTFRKT